MEYLKEILKKSGRASIIESIIFAILGIILVNNPVGTVKVITGILGTIFIVIGIIKIINYFISKGNSDFYNFDLIYGLTAIVIGIVAMAYMNIIGSVFRIIIGVWIIYTSFVSINTSLQLRKIGGTTWIWSLVLAVIMFACGLYTVINPGTIVATIGAIMIIYSVLDIIENVIFMKNVNKIL